MSQEVVVVEGQGGAPGGGSWLLGLLLIGGGLWVALTPSAGTEAEAAAVYALGHVKSERSWAISRLKALASQATKEKDSTLTKRITGWEQALQQMGG